MENEDKIEQIHRMLEDLESQLAHIKQSVEDAGFVDETRSIKDKAQEVGSTEAGGDETIIEGVFDGQNVVGPDGKTYTVPANYASKSKLAEGDIMKLTIKNDGSFIYKQIGPVARKRLTGKLVRTETGGYRAVTGKGRSYRLLTASVTYYKGEPGDTVVMLVPEEIDSKWAAVENVVQGLEEGEELPLGDDMELPGPSGELPLGDEIEIEGPDEEVLEGDEEESEEDDSEGISVYI
ncbi:hypothetical protein ACFL2M_00685 [Patescibacteria group bacterium]